MAGARTLSSSACSDRRTSPRSVPIPVIEELREGHPPPRHDRTVFRIVIGWDSYRNDLLFRRVEQTELVRVVVQPAHRVLDGDV